MRSSVPQSSCYGNDSVHQLHKSRSTNLVQASENMRQVNDRVSVLIHLVEYVVAEQLDDIPVSCFRPAWFTGESSNSSENLVESSTAKKHALWPLVDEPKFTQQTDQSTILKFTGELTLEPVCATVTEGNFRTHFPTGSKGAYVWASSISSSSRFFPIISMTCAILYIHRGTRNESQVGLGKGPVYLV